MTKCPEGMEVVEEVEVDDPEKPLLDYLKEVAKTGDVILLCYDSDTGRRFIRLCRQKGE